MEANRVEIKFHHKILEVENVGKAAQLLQTIKRLTFVTGELKEAVALQVLTLEDA